MRQSVNNKPGQKQKRRFTRLCEQETKKKYEYGENGKNGRLGKEENGKKILSNAALCVSITATLMPCW